MDWDVLYRAAALVVPEYLIDVRMVGAVLLIVVGVVLEIRTWRS